MPHLIVRTGHVTGYDLFVCRDTVVVAKGGALVARHTVPDYGTSLAGLVERPGFALGWGRFPDGAEAIYFYDKHDDNFGYALNLDHPDCSEWGIAPFERLAA